MASQREPNEQGGTRYGRRSPYEGSDRPKGEKRPGRRIDEKLLKYEVQAAGFEFIPALMHTLERYVEGVAADEQTDLERRLADALEEISDARELLRRAVEADREIPLEIKARAFSTSQVRRPRDQGIDDAEMTGIIERTNLLVNLPVADLKKRPGGRLPEPRADGCCCPPDQPPDEKEPPPPPPNQYEVTFTKLYCVDESDPEWFGSDEPYVVFAVITEEMAEAGTAAAGFHTPVYADVDDGDTRPDSGDENLRVFGFTGPRPIASSVLITGSCFENDLGNPEETTEGVRTALTTVATTAAGVGGVAGWVVAGAAAVAIGVTYLVDLIGADDAIDDTQAISLTQAEADSRTAGGPYLFPPLHFDGGDGDGIYDAYLRLRRV
jgi:hypothetical protein